MRRADPELPVVFDRRDAGNAGLSEEQIRRRAAGRWDRLRRGQFTQRSLDGEDRWRAQVLAVLRAHRRPLVLSHASAARAWGLPSPVGGWPRTTFTSDQPPVRRSGDAVVLVAALAAGDSVPMGAITCTSVARTVADCARRLEPHDALAVADAALRRGLITEEAVRSVLERQARWPGCARAGRVLALADGRRESALESWSAWAFDVHRVPPPVWQVNLCDAQGVFLGRVDCWWPEGIVGEADGGLKYRLAAAERGGVSAEGLAAVLDDERRRERGLRHAGLPIVRWSAGDVLDEPRAAALAATLAAERRHADPRRFAGRAFLA